MKKTAFIAGGIIVGLFVIVAVAGFFRFNRTNDGDIFFGKMDASDVKNMSLAIGSELFALENGKAEKEIAPDSANKNTLVIFGEPVYGDLNDDKKEDAALLLVNNPGGSGTLYYAVLAINGENGYKATNAIFLGDRIASQTVEIREGHALYNFTERKPGEPMETTSSVGKSFWVFYNKTTGEINEWVR
ncbi:MAG: hypothetical protein WC878_00810 [Candidatus Paceibacterota bacterium]|jgi:hypothetical protein